MGEVTLERKGAVAVVTISSPEVRNGLTAEMAEELIAICEGIDADSSIGAAVVKGAGGTFCSGADTREWGRNSDPASEDAFRRTSATYGSFFRFGRLAVPTIAAIRGAAVGAGLNLALAADLRVVAENARLIGGFMRADIHPGGGFFTLVGRLGGREAAAALGLFNDELSGSRAVALGIAWEALPDNEVEGRAESLAEIAAKDPELARLTLASFRLELGPPMVSWPSAVEMERGIQMWSQRRRQQRLSSES